MDKEEDWSFRVICDLIKDKLTIRLISDKDKLVEPTEVIDYFPKIILEKDWEVLRENDRTEAVGRKAEWTFGGGKAKIYGFYVTSMDGKVIWSERAKEGPWEVLRKGDRFSVKPKIIVVCEE